MKVSEAQIEERLPVWTALSEIFLDTELQPEDYDRIAQTLAATSYSEEELEDILRFEVCPVCKWNLLPPAGEWVGFDPGWLKEKISRRLGKRPMFKTLFIMRHRWMYASHYDLLRVRIAAIRSK